MRLEQQMAMALLAMALPPETILVNEKAQLPKTEEPPDFILRPAPDPYGAIPQRRAYIGERVHVSVDPALQEQVITQLRTKRLERNRAKMQKGA